MYLRDHLGIPQYSPARREVHDATRLGNAILRESFTALHLTIRRDTPAQVRTAWPSCLAEYYDHFDCEPEPVRPRFTPQQTRRAGIYCEIFVSMPGHQPWQKKSTVIKVLKVSATWKEVADLVGRQWTECRDSYDSCLLQFVYTIADYEGITLEQAIAR